MNKKLSVGILTSLLFSANALALKVNTHVWIADEIINDVQDGSLTIKVDGKPVYIPINDALKFSILNFKKEFRAGAIGPDAYPDPIVGQMSIHPGSSDLGYHQGAWNTDDWLKHITDSATAYNEKSFAYGNLVHAASDIVSHSYVNMYAGEAFDYVEHSPVGNEPERRHLLLESYIGELTPNLSSGLGFHNSVASPFTHFGTDYLARTFLYDPKEVKSLVQRYGSSSTIRYPKIIQQYKDAAEEGVIGGAHLLSIYETRYKVEQFIQSNALSEIDNFFAGGAILDLTDTGLSKSLVDLTQKIKAANYKSITQIQNLHDGVNNIINKSSLKAFSATEKAAIEANRMAVDLVKFQGEIFSLERKVLDLEAKVRRISCPWWDYVCKKLNDEISRNLIKLNEAKSQLNGKIANYTSSKNLLLSAVQKLNSVVKSAQLVKASIKNSHFELAKVLNKDVNPVRAILINWAEGIDAAMLSYKDVGLKIMQAEMAKQDPIKPVRDWAFKDCNMQKLVGFGDGLGGSICKVQSNGEALLDVLSDLSPFFGHGVTLQIQEKISGLQESTLNDSFETMFTQKLDDIAPGFIDFIQLLKQNVTPSVLNNEFRDGGTEGYLKISDMAARVDAELRVVHNSSFCRGKAKCFNQHASPLIFNSIQLSKIALLNKYELQDLERKTNGKVSLYRGNRYGTINSASFQGSLLFRGVNSIDGNHQWLGRYSPPLPRDKTHPQNYSWDHAKYYGDYSGQILGATSNDRVGIMYSLFKGPLNEGLFTPNALGFSTRPALLTDTYRSFFDECKGHIFQLDLNDHYCNGVEDKPKSTTPVQPPREDFCVVRGRRVACP